MQLVEQRFEFVFAERIVSGMCKARTRRGWRRRSSHRFRFRHRRRRFGGNIQTIGKGAQRLDHRLRRRRRRHVLGHGVEHAAHQIHRGQDVIHDLGVELATACAQHIEHVLADVAEVDDVAEGEESGATLDGVEAAEDRVQQCRVFRRALQRDEFLIELGDQFAAFSHVIGTQFVVEIIAHGGSG